MKILTDVDATRRAVRAWRRAGVRVALVPTMGNLHAGHMSLVKLARQHADRVIVSVFVNPTQFGPGEDYASYPRTPAADQSALRRAGIDGLFRPTVARMYPDGQANATRVSVPSLSRDLCGAFRPVHFDGVTSVVLRLFNIIGPDLAVFGEKDYQQLVLLRLMTRDLHLPIRLIGAPTVREPDGLAMSSRNQYLTAAERACAPELFLTLMSVRAELLAGDCDYAAVERRALRRLRRRGFRPDYLAIRAAADLAGPRAARDLRVLAAAWLGRTRLIDNVALRRRS